VTLKIEGMADFILKYIKIEKESFLFGTILLFLLYFLFSKVKKS